MRFRCTKLPVRGCSGQQPNRVIFVSFILSRRYGERKSTAVQGQELRRFWRGNLKMTHVKDSALEIMLRPGEAEKEVMAR